MRNDLNLHTLSATWLEDENGKRVAYFDKNTEIIKGEENMKKVIYALFDDENQSVKNTLEPLGYEVYSFGIQKKRYSYLL